jgi:hypothetical protein
MTVVDPVGDFVATYDGPQNPDLDVTSFSVNFDTVANNFLLNAVFAGAINPSGPGFYVVGVNTGTPTLNFASLGLPGVTFNKVIVIQKDGSAAIGPSSLASLGGSVTVNGDHFDALVPLSALLPATGADPLHFGFNIWPRGGTPAQLKQPISDFAPDNAVLASVPEASTWATMILGFGLVGVFLRGRPVRYQFGQRTARLT